VAETSIVNSAPPLALVLPILLGLKRERPDSFTGFRARAEVIPHEHERFDVWGKARDAEERFEIKMQAWCQTPL
jgi:hypothetical protein